MAAAKVARKTFRGSIDKGGSDDKIPLPVAAGSALAVKAGKKPYAGEPLKAAGVRL